MPDDVRPFAPATFLRRQATEHPGEPMLTSGAEQRTWAQLAERAAQVAQALRAEGVGPGDRVAFVDRNGLPHFETLFGCALLGAVHVAVNWRLAPGEVGAVLADAQPTVVVADPGAGGVGGRLLPDQLAATGARRLVLLGPLPPGSTPDVPTVDYQAWLADQPGEDPGHEPALEEPAIQLYTSGTTGQPKGVVLSVANLATAMATARRVFGVQPDTVSLVAMPLFHIGGIGWALAAMSQGGASVVLRDVDPGVILELIERHGVTETFVVPAVLMALLAHPRIEGADLSSLRTVFYGASPIAEDVLVRCLARFGCGFAQLYGMTETTGAITMLAPEDHDPSGPRRHLLRSAGRPLPGVELRIVDPTDGRLLGAGEVGEVQTRSPFTMLGYFRRPEETAATIDPDGWLRTGDAGYLDEEGYLFLHDRIKDMIVSGGENVYPAEVENVLLGHPQVADAAVIGVPDDRWGETVKAVVVPAPGAPPAEELAPALIAYCRERLAHYKCPTSVDLVESLPRNPTGKVLKRVLREPYWQGIERRIR